MRVKIKVWRPAKLKVRGKLISIDAETTGMLPWGGPRQILLNFGNKKKPEVVKRMVAPARAFVWTMCDEYGNTEYLRAKVDPVTREVRWDPRQKAAVAKIWGDPT